MQRLDSFRSSISLSGIATQEDDQIESSTDLKCKTARLDLKENNFETHTPLASINKMASRN